jgi:hypothetical protein
MIFSDKLAIACVITRKSAHSAHVFVARGRMIYDACLEEPVSREEHPRKNWYIAWLIEPDLP